MNRLLVMIVSLKYLIGIVSITPSEVGAKEDITKYKNCSELNKVYPGGVAKAANVKNKRFNHLSKRTSGVFYVYE